jgi:hypothetical protein
MVFMDKCRQMGKMVQACGVCPTFGKREKRDNIFCLKKEIFEKTDMMFKENRFRHELSFVFNP